MKTIWQSVVLLLVFALAQTHGADQDLLRLEQKIPLPNVKGRIDHMAVDVEGGRLFIAALGNDTVEIVDLKKGERVHTITGLHEPQGVLFLPELNRLVVANAKNGACHIYDGKSYEMLKDIDFNDDADNLRYDPAAKQFLVGYGDGALGIVDASTGTVVKTVKLSGHPEAFQLEASGKRVFVNVPTSRKVQVIDREKGEVIANWDINDAKSNFPMALDETNHRLFIGCRSPSRILILNTESGKTVASLDCVGDTDDVFFNATSKRIYVSGGEGFISIFEQTTPDIYGNIGKIETAPGARTSFFIKDRMCLAVPARNGKEAAIWLYIER